MNAEAGSMNISLGDAVALLEQRAERANRTLTEVRQVLEDGLALTRKELDLIARKEAWQGLEKQIKELVKSTNET